MKTVFKFSGIITIFALIVLISACEEDKKDTDGGMGGGGSNITVSADTLKLAGKVFTLSQSLIGMPQFKEFKGNVALNSISTGSGAITNGSLNFTIGEPDEYDLTPLSSSLDYYFYGYEDISQDATEVSHFVINSLESESYDYYGPSLMKIEYTSTRVSMENVFFIYVDKPVKITASGYTESDEGDQMTHLDINIQLTKGWNALSEKYESTMSGSKSSVSKLNKVSSSYTWLLSERDYDW